ncbi:MAG: fumarate hydratase [Rhodocyclaceae bacterium]|nr:fumarate hydratase [Rhodocyclaceae bacterium]MCA3026370.1 fumarate hydratase [Rhodocyclaceae bacterium]MCA3033001.1 fumarate hydratase [Rhodocyclaceae bacterium]MCA3036406.1 fumarate hydratase [Rhodocyclaceae bacterium]MCA3041286.1 fumarate hydratase [Rhodocyclaceae bacterium]
MPTVIKQEDFISSVADAFQYISYYHPVDYIKALHEAYQKEQSPAAKDAMAQILINSRMAAEGHRPICQDTGICIAFIRVGMDVRFEGPAVGPRLTPEQMVNEGVRRAYTDINNPLRGSMLTDPDGKRKNTTDNTPGVTHIEIVPGDKVEVIVAAKGGGSENKSKFAMLLPNDNIVDWILSVVPTMGADWCPPGMLSLGIGGSPEKAMLMAKWAMMEPLNIHELQARGPSNRAEELRLEIYEKVNALGIGAQGLGGLSTVLDVKVTDYPTHAASKPVALLPNCAAMRHAHFVLDGSGPAVLEPPSLADWPSLTQDLSTCKRINIDGISKAQLGELRSGDRVLLSGKILTGRDAAHRRLVEMMNRGEKLPVDFTGRIIYYVGPVNPVGDEVVGPAGPTTASRMDKFTADMLERTGLIGMIGKSERGTATIENIKKNGATYFIAVGGAAYLVSKAIKSSRLVAFEDLGMEAIYEFEVKDMPVTVAVDSTGTAVHRTGPQEWRTKIGKIPVVIV